VQTLLSLIAGIAIACGGDALGGTYHGREGAIVLELKRDHTAEVLFMGQSQSCTYESTKQEVKLTCPDPRAGVGGLRLLDLLGTVRRNQDGTLTSDLGVLAKRTTN